MSTSYTTGLKSGKYVAIRARSLEYSARSLLPRDSSKCTSKRRWDPRPPLKPALNNLGERRPAEDDLRFKSPPYRYPGGRWGGKSPIPHPLQARARFLELFA